MVVCVGTRRGESGPGSCLVRWLLLGRHGGMLEKVHRLSNKGQKISALGETQCPL